MQALSYSGQMPDLVFRYENNFINRKTIFQDIIVLPRIKDDKPWNGRWNKAESRGSRQLRQTRAYDQQTRQY